jgi:hypothetical protein
MADEKSLASQTIESAEPRRSWDRRRDETRRAFTAFCLFRDSTDRKLASVAKALTPPCSVPNVARWSARHNWQQRAVDYDVHVDEQHLAEMARSRVSARKRRLQIAHALEGLGAQALREWQNRIAAGLPLNLSPETIALLSKTGAQLEEQALGPEKDRRFTKIIVTLGDAPDLGEAPAESSSAALNDDTTGEGSVGGKQPN